MSKSRWMVLHIPVDPLKRNPHDGNHQEYKNTAFGTDRAARQPPWTLKGRVQEMSGHDGAAVGHGIQERFSPVEREMKSHGEPKIAGAPQGQAEKQSDQARGEFSVPGLARISLMSKAEQQRQQDGARP